MTENELLQRVIALLAKEQNLKQRYASVVSSFEKELVQANLDRYRIGVIGVTSSGKSTMINAILGDDLLSMAVKPSSSQLVTCSKSSEKKATVYFEDKPQAEFKGSALTPELIKRYSDENYNTKNVEKVKQLELSTPNFAFPSEILLVDSPGLDAFGLDGHERLTMNSLLPTIDFCIFVTTFKTNSDEKMKSVLDTIAEYNCPVIIVQNMLDSVKPSPDGKKSSVDVANEHKLRVERIINHSRISDKSSVSIVQISSKLALEGRLEKNAEKLARSNYSKLVEAVKVTLERIKPRIEAKRMNSIRRRLSELVDDARQDISPDASTNKTAVFEFEGLAAKLERDSEETHRVLEKIIEALVVQMNNLRQSNPNSASNFRFTGISAQIIGAMKKLVSNQKFEEKDLDSIRELVNQCENSILDIMKAYNKKISKCCQRLGVDERRIRTVDSFGDIPGLRAHTKQVHHRRKKDGFGNKIARFFGGIFNTDWGYTDEYVPEYDEEATRKSAIEYLGKVIKIYTSTCDKWVTNNETIIEELCAEIESRREAFIARQAKVEDEQAMLHVIEGLEAAINDIPVINYNTNDKVEHTAADLDVKLSAMIVNKSVLALHDTAKYVRSVIHRLTSEQAGILCAGKTIIISWDCFCTAMFLKNSFNIMVSEDKLGSTARFGGITVVGAPTAEELRGVIEENQGGIKWVLLFNATQYGSAMKALNDVGIAGLVKSDKDSLYLVVQDFEELRNGGGTRDALENMTKLSEELGIRCHPFILLNDDNPIYSLTAIQVQKSRCETHADEVALINCIQGRFPFLLNPAAERTLHDIIQAL